MENSGVCVCVCPYAIPFLLVLKWQVVCARDQLYPASKQQKIQLFSSWLAFIAVATDLAGT
jgi:hypothetical protein